MSFLAPLFLVGALAVSLPILFHFIRRTTRERLPFSSLMFLLASPPRLTQRNRIEHLLLLLLRCTVIGLLAFGFARPFLREAVAPPPSGAGKRVLLLVDVSASMRRPDLWPEAVKRVEAVLRKTVPGDQVGLFTFDQQIHPLFTFEQWNASPPGQRTALVLAKLASTGPGWGSTHLANALVQAAETLADPAGKNSTEQGRVELITDLQEGSRLEQLQGYEWPKTVELSVDVLKPRDSGNASLQLVSDADESENSGTGKVRVRVANAPGSKREQFKVGWASAEKAVFADKPIEVYVPAGQSRIVAVPVPANRSLDRIMLQGDAEDFDNLIFASPPEAVRLNVVYIGKEAETDPHQGLYFIQRAFQETRHQVTKVAAHRPGELIPAAEVESSCLFILTAPPSNDAADALRAQVTAGKTLLLVLEDSTMAGLLNRVLGVDNVKVEAVRPSNYAMLGEIDFRHPLFAPFADPRFSDFTKIHFWKYARLDSAVLPRARVVARFDNGDPALLEVPLGSGRILILTSGWAPGSSQLALSSKFVPLLYAIIESSGAPAPLPAQYRIGDSVPIDVVAGGPVSHAVVHLPDGSQMDLAAGDTNFTLTAIPGVYKVDTGTATKKFVVNLDPEESRTAPLPPDELERLGLPTDVLAGSQRPEAVRKVRLQNAELENRQKLWRWFIEGTLVGVLFETWLAGRTARAGASASLAGS